jgi:hypothetical protein
LNVGIGKLAHIGGFYLRLECWNWETGTYWWFLSPP